MKSYGWEWQWLISFLVVSDNVWWDLSSEWWHLIIWMVSGDTFKVKLVTLSQPKDTCCGILQTGLSRRIETFTRVHVIWMVVSFLIRPMQRNLFNACSHGVDHLKHKFAFTVCFKYILWNFFLFFILFNSFLVCLLLLSWPRVCCRFIWC